jgi:hypothetical protein
MGPGPSRLLGTLPPEQLFRKPNAPLSVALALPARHGAAVIPLDGSGDVTAVLARAHPNAARTNTDSHARIPPITMLIAIAIALSIAANLHVDAALSYLKASRVCGDGPSKQWCRRRKNRCGRHEKYDCLHVGSPFRKSPNDLTLTNPESSVHHGRPRRLLSTEVGSWSKTRKGKKVEAKNSFQACQVTGTTAQLR